MIDIIQNDVAEIVQFSIEQVTENIKNATDSTLREINKKRQLFNDIITKQIKWNDKKLRAPPITISEYQEKLKKMDSKLSIMFDKYSRHKSLTGTNLSTHDDYDRNHKKTCEAIQEKLLHLETIICDFKSCKTLTNEEKINLISSARRIHV